jgi:hypothetical protein
MNSEGVVLEPVDHEVRGALTRRIAALGHAPSNAELAAEMGLSVIGVGASLRRLNAAHALLLHPESTRPWVVHPFALSPGSCWVETPARGYWANCLYCGFGIAAALKSDATITTRLGGEGEAVRYSVENGKPHESSDVFHLSTPVAAWWENVIFACASFQPFRSEADVDAWCARHALPKGAVLTMPALWAFASDWYGHYLQPNWRKRTADEVRALFERHRLTGPFWSVE